MNKVVHLIYRYTKHKSEDIGIILTGEDDAIEYCKQGNNWKERWDDYNVYYGCREYEILTIKGDSQ